MSVQHAVRAPGRAKLRQPLVFAGTLALFGALPLFAFAVVTLDLAGGGAGWAFREAFLGAAEEVLRGGNPYPGLEDPSLVEGTAYVYPPVVALVTVPFTVVPEGLAVVGFALILAAAVLATLAVLGVRDWRCYGVALLWPAVLSAVHVENITILMGLAAALVWRFRDRPAGGVSLGVSIAVKPLLWPLVAWLAATRRLSTLAWGAIVAVVLVLASWAAIGFAGFVEYEALLRRLSELMDEWGYSVYALALDLGAGDVAARMLWFAAAACLLAGSVVVSRRGDDRRGFVLAMAAVIACSPIVWLHYFALLLVIVAVAQPRLGWVWFLPLAMYASEELQNGTPLQTGVTLATFAVTVAAALWVCPPAAEARGRAVPLAESPA